MQTSKLTILVRTFPARAKRADFLRDVLVEYFKCPVFCICVESQKNYSQGFMVELTCFFESYDGQEQYFLIVEDDMLFSNSAESIVSEAIENALPHLWCSIPEQAILKNAMRLSESIGFVFLAKPIYYSGAILFEKSVLMRILSEYCLDFLSLAQPNADVFMSDRLTRNGEPLFISHTSFATDKKVQSALSHRQTVEPFRKKAVDIDCFFDFSDIAPHFDTQAARIFRLSQTAEPDIPQQKNQTICRDIQYELKKQVV